MRNLIFLLLLGLCSLPLHAGVVGEEVVYSGGDKTMKGYIAYDKNQTGKRPAVLVVHEWWGHNEYARERARMLAKLGYTALAVDMYGDGAQADHPKDAGAFAGEVRKNMDVAEARFNAALSLLQQHPTVSAGDVSAIGYCFGGGIVLEMVRRGVDLDLVASFHGSLMSPAPAAESSLKGRKVMVFNGAADPMVKAEHISGFKEEMKSAGADLTFVNHPDALHAFTNPGADALGEKFNIPLGYNAAADKQSWQGLKEGLEAVYGR